MDVNAKEVIATWACQKGQKKVGCNCKTCSARYEIYGLNVPVQIQEEAISKADRDKITIKEAVSIIMEVKNDNTQ